MSPEADSDKEIAYALRLRIKDKEQFFVNGEFGFRIYLGGDVLPEGGHRYPQIIFFVDRKTSIQRTNALNKATHGHFSQHFFSRVSISLSTPQSAPILVGRHLEYAFKHTDTSPLTATGRTLELEISCQEHSFTVQPASKDLNIAWVLDRQRRKIANQSQPAHQVLTN